MPLHSRWGKADEEHDVWKSKECHCRGLYCPSQRPQAQAGVGCGWHQALAPPPCMGLSLPTAGSGKAGAPGSAKGMGWFPCPSLCDFARRIAALGLRFSSATLEPVELELLEKHIHISNV